MVSESKTPYDAQPYQQPTYQQGGYQQQPYQQPYGQYDSKYEPVPPQPYYPPPASYPQSAPVEKTNPLVAVLLIPGGFFASFLGPFGFIFACCIRASSLLWGLGIGYIVQAAIAALLFFGTKLCNNTCAVITDQSTVVRITDPITGQTRLATTAERQELRQDCETVCQYVNYAIIGGVVVYLVFAVIAFLWALARARRNRRAAQGV